jgi:hypothetical protein
MNLQNRNQSLDESKFIDQKERDKFARRMATGNFNLDAEKAVQNDAYRQNLLMQRQKEAQYDALMDLHKNSSAEAKQALDLVKDGMDPEEVIGLFRLNPRDQQLVRSYRATADRDQSLEEDPMLDYLNEMELGMRQKLPQEEEPGLWGRTKQYAMEAARGAVGMRGIHAPLPTQGPPAPPNSRALYDLPDPSNPAFQEMYQEAAKRGFSYDPTQRGFYSNRPQYQPPAPPAQTDQRLAALPLITSREQLEEMIRTGQIRRGQQFRTYGGKVKTVH